MLVDMSLKEFYQVLSSDSPAPGGGSVAALSGAMGAGLVSMVCNLTMGKKGYENVSENAEKTMARSGSLGQDLIGYIDVDTNAFNEVMAAFKMPKETDEQKKARSAAIQEGYKAAIRSPLTIAEACLEIMELADGMLGKGNSNALSDLGVGADMAYSGLKGAVMNVEINLPSIKDETFASDTTKKISSLENRGAVLAARIREYVKKGGQA
ncbi:Formiminotransferase-cyclodeaminase [Dethiosulfovibrio peptidovorans DSM 11002]|uniref:Formiminotransferase-cyclodeaminase n=1 Tax=Dethiosulfovibrio peptidovorans DSM 11002 TaxID=469381 RepID=D2Z7S7_9BACT|nr:cyclodeaminase/cyclohydrolase family protein [Dethiosulfovibrio peptidovorans]EFC91524.1 Formiminotransferase-cyclodeaminase [Dethiosulfovibrio peptidovorans DSM 11002]